MAGSCPDWAADADRQAELLQLLTIYRDVMRMWSKLSISSGMVCAWHQGCFQGHVPAGYAYYAGNMRQVNPAMPCLDTPISVGQWVTPTRFVPFMQGASADLAVPESDQLFVEVEEMCVELKRDWSSMSEGERLAGLLVAASYAMGRFNHIHPFINGNGRMTRLIMKWVLARFGYKSDIGVKNRPTPSEDYNKAMNAATRRSYRPLMDFMDGRVTNA